MTKKKKRETVDKPSSNVNTLRKEENVLCWYKNKWVLILKILLVVAVVLICICYTDGKRCFDPDMEGARHATFKRWESFYDLTENDSVDILILGNSHANYALNPKNLSATTGTISFVLAQSGSDISDAYFCLEEALTRTRPKLCVIETFAASCEGDFSKRRSANSRMINFSARKNFRLKVKSMPDLFQFDDYLAVWSPTVRNHEFLFRDTARIKRNILLLEKPELKVKVAFDTIPLYLGRMIRFTSGMTDSVLNIYKEKGARIVCTDTAASYIHPEAEYYLLKISSLCEKNGIPLLFLTCPMFHKHIENYELWHDALAKIIDPLNAKWYDMQLNYDSAAFTPACFEDTYDFNQHITYYGSMITTYKLANYIHDSMDVVLPNRFEDPHWNELFYGQEGYFFNCSPTKGDTIRHLISENQTVGDLHVKALFWEEMEKSKRLTLMISKSEKTAKRDSLILVLNGKMNGHVVRNAHVTVSKVVDVDPVHHNLYMVNIIKEFDPVSLATIKLPISK